MHGIAVLELVSEAPVRVAPLFSNLDLASHEDGGKRLLEDGPENRHGGTHDGEVDLETGEDDGYRRPPGKVDIRICGGAVIDDRVEAPDGGEDDAVIVSI